MGKHVGWSGLEWLLLLRAAHAMLKLHLNLADRVLVPLLRPSIRSAYCT